LTYLKGPSDLLAETDVFEVNRSIDLMLNGLTMPSDIAFYRIRNLLFGYVDQHFSEPGNERRLAAYSGPSKHSKVCIDVELKIRI
jgi:hypothetical protein